ncbi:hypothetical protein Kpho02_32660 [Kitasatospora phosalacinea]|uniref:Aminoglycoside phosphotransferase domain-containing protein n=1 Tax=Kitasatospora phosalacinea TaxID=2065 RepID=A0A9W6V370_9ACTN|nr:hypothetical protein [Kitasatospora phosalacinea]GLW70967.1 hypothetical protein Kpho02_32660 [Kitasatospora phosalacinea]
MDEITRAAGALLGQPLRDPVDLGGSPRSTVLRCRTATGGSVVVKAFVDEPEARRAYAGEAAGLSLGLAGPELLAADHEQRLLVMADLGDAPTLADLLLGTDPKAAERGLLEWAGGLGRLAARSVPRRAEFAALWQQHGRGLPSWEDEPWQQQNVGAFLGLLAECGLTAPPGLAEELTAVGTADGERYPGFTPGDTCPDNNLITPDGLRLLDFEAAGYQSVFLTAAYCRMPFSSCWCVHRLPDDLARRVEGAYRAEVVVQYPDLAEDALWQAGMDRATVVWTVDSTLHLLRRALPEDGPMHRTRQPVPTRRQVLRHRWTSALGLTGHPAFAATVRLLLAELAAGWDAPELPGYPAFRATG